MNITSTSNRVTIHKSVCPPKTWQWLREKVGLKNSDQFTLIYLMEDSATHHELIRRATEEKRK